VAFASLGMSKFEPWNEALKDACLGFYAKRQDHRNDSDTAMAMTGSLDCDESQATSSLGLQESYTGVQQEQSKGRDKIKQRKSMKLFARLRKSVGSSPEKAT
jgi:hypothetical protein